MDNDRDAGRLATARELMDGFARSTGLIDGSGPTRRYLWTDAFAVCNFLELGGRTGEECYLELARALVDAVHQTLGRHRQDDPRSGWISGLDEAEGREHPLAGGLRIGKPLPERSADAAYDAQAEWDRDGQYYHYLTKWMHALARMGGVLGEARYSTWGVELAHAVHPRFRQRAPGGTAYLAWKMSIDLSRPLVPAAGHHDPLDGLVTALELADGTEALAAERAELLEMCEARDWTTDDPLGLGGLLFDAARLSQLPRWAPEDLLANVLASAAEGLPGFAGSGVLKAEPARRLAFRELGLAIGLHALDGVLSPERLDARGRRLWERLAPFRPLARSIEETWLDAGSRVTATWRDHEDINTVMLATALTPAGFLRI